MSRKHDPTIRQYRPHDNGQIWALASLLTLDPDPTRPTPPIPLPAESAAPAQYPDLGNIQRHFLVSGGDFLVAELDGAIVGTAGLLMTGRDTADVVRVLVHPAVRRQGVGTALLETIEWRAEGLGVRRLNLEVSDDHKASIPFYLEYGFRGHDREVDDPQWDGNLSKALKVLP